MPEDEIKSFQNLQFRLGGQSNLVSVFEEESHRCFEQNPGPDWGLLCSVLETNKVFCPFLRPQEGMS